MEFYGTEIHVCTFLASKKAKKLGNGNTQITTVVPQDTVLQNNANNSIMFLRSPVEPHPAYQPQYNSPSQPPETHNFHP
jgi:hypothetical protein